MIFRSVMLALLLVACAANRASMRSPAVDQGGPPAARSGSAERGAVFVQAQCASCHATSGVGPSPMVAAPPLREISRRYPVDHLGEAFAEGFVTSHSTMPEFVLDARQNRDLIAHLASIQTE